MGAKPVPSRSDSANDNSGAMAMFMVAPCWSHPLISNRRTRAKSGRLGGRGERLSDFIASVVGFLASGRGARVALLLEQHLRSRLELILFDAVADQVAHDAVDLDVPALRLLIELAQVRFGDAHRDAQLLRIIGFARHDAALCNSQTADATA